MEPFDKLTLVLTDIHVPFHDQKLLNTVLEFIDDLQPQTIVLGGDFFDFYSLSSFDKSRERAECLQYELDVGAEVLSGIRNAAPISRIVFLPGNHEHRIVRFLNSGNKALSGLRALRLEELLQLDEWDIKYRPYSYKICKDLVCIHGVKCGKYPARGELAANLCNGISGHAHKDDFSSMAGFDRTLRWWSVGGLWDKAQLDEHYSESLRWSRSFALVRHNDKDFDVEIIHVQENNKKASFYCKYTGKTYT